MNIPMKSANTLETFIEIAYTASVDSSCWPRDAGGSTSNPGPRMLANRRASNFDRRVLVQFDVNAIEAAASAEHLLSRIDIHHRQVSAKGAGQDRRTA